MKFTSSTRSAPSAASASTRSPRTRAPTSEACGARAASCSPRRRSPARRARVGSRSTSPRRCRSTPTPTYVVSYYAPVGHYAQAEGYFYPPSVGGARPQRYRRQPAPARGAEHRAGDQRAVRVQQHADVPGEHLPRRELLGRSGLLARARARPGHRATATAGNSAAAVSWTAPSSGRPSRPTSSRPTSAATAQPSTTVTGSPAPTSTTITGLTNGTTYTFTVTASNPNGNAAPSAASNAVTPSGALSAAFNSGFESGLTYWSAGGVPGSQREHGEGAQRHVVGAAGDVGHRARRR